ncbi:MAG: hypothetical protein KJ063_19460 [Anaerolineae bacterium]|nr:hypothetical protein [Anaerolineae bacterium]
MENDPSFRKIAEAFKGLIKTSALNSPSKKLLEYFFEGKKEYWPSLRYVKINGQILYPVYRISELERLTEQISRSFGDQVSHKTISSYIMEAAFNWIENDYRLDNDSHVEKTVRKLKGNIQNDIHDFDIYVAIEGLEFENSIVIEIVDGYIQKNTESSELLNIATLYAQQLHLDTHLIKEFQEPPAFFKVRVRGDSEQAIKQGTEEAEMALDVLRLFLGSFYSDIYLRPSSSIRMSVKKHGLVSERLSVLGVRTDLSVNEQIPGVYWSQKFNFPFKINEKLLSLIKENGLEQINTSLRAVKNKKETEIDKRLFTAIKWFAKATATQNIEDSYLMYAISLEALLSEDRTAQESYALQIASLVHGSGINRILPLGGQVSKEFGKKLKKSTDSNDRFNCVRNRAYDLFKIRNHVVHGRHRSKLDIGDLLDLETLARNTILAFIKRGWNEFGDFKTWVTSSVSFQFNPGD